MKFRLPLIATPVCGGSGLGSWTEIITIKSRGHLFLGESCSCKTCKETNIREYRKIIKKTPLKNLNNLDPWTICPNCESNKIKNSFNNYACLLCKCKWENIFKFSHTEIHT